MQWQYPVKLGSLICSRNSLHIHFVSSVRSVLQGQYPLFFLSPSWIKRTISLFSLYCTLIFVIAPFLLYIFSIAALLHDICNKITKFFVFCYWIGEKSALNLVNIENGFSQKYTLYVKNRQKFHFCNILTYYLIKKTLTII